MKTVFTDISKVAHLWANQLQDTARNSGNFYFDTDTIYSYGRHFAIAKHVTNDKGEKAVLFTTASYSNTTAKHIRVVSQAANHLNKIYCQSPQGSHESNFKSFTSEIENIAGNLPKAKKPEKYLNQIDSVKTKINEYVAFFGLDIPATLQAAMNIASADKYKQYADIKAAALKAESEARAKAQKVQHAKELTKWRSGKTDRLYTHDGFDYLRFNKEKNRIETSQYVQIPVEIGKSFYPVILRKIKGGGCIECNTKFMEWEVLEINKDFIRIGCHKIAFKELQKMAKQLGI